MALGSGLNWGQQAFAKIDQTLSKMTTNQVQGIGLMVENSINAGMGIGRLGVLGRIAQAEAQNALLNIGVYAYEKDSRILDATRQRALLIGDTRLYAAASNVDPGSTSVQNWTASIAGDTARVVAGIELDHQIKTKMAQYQADVKSYQGKLRQHNQMMQIFGAVAEAGFGAMVAGAGSGDSLSGFKKGTGFSVDASSIRSGYTPITAYTNPTMKTPGLQQFAAGRIWDW